MVQETAQKRNETAQQNGTAPELDTRRTKRLSKELPKGIRIGSYTDGRRKPFFVRFGASRTVESFESECTRNDRAEELATISDQHGRSALDFDPVEWRAYQAFKSRTGATLLEMEMVWEQRRGKVDTSLTTRDAIARYLKLVVAEGLKVKGDSYLHLRAQLRDRFAGKFGDVPLYKITTEDIRGWVFSLVNPRNGKPMSNTTRHHHRMAVHVFFQRAKLEKWVSDNPCEAVIPPQKERTKKPLMPVADAFRFLRANLDQPVMPKIALEMFGFMRCSSVERMKPDQIKRAKKGIFMPGEDHKSGEDVFRQGHPDVLWAWIDHATAATWEEITAKNYDEKKGEAFIRADIKNTGNVLRHSCVSYLLASSNNMPLVSRLAQHRHASTTEGYEGIAEKEDADLWLAMTPQAIRSAATFEEFRENQLSAPKT